jgi:flagellar motility protein MotE (MotC chaperone)
MPQPNEVENLLLGSLKRLSEESEQREKRMTEFCSECAASFEEQSSTLGKQYDEVSKRLDGLTQRLAKLTAQLAALHPSWPKR